MAITVDTLYEKFMDKEFDFAEDVFDFFGKDQLSDLNREAWAKEYGSYLPTWDPSQVNLAKRGRGLAYKNAMDTLRTTKEATEHVYSTELDTLSTSLGKELGKGREIAGGIGLRTGSLEGARQDSIAVTGSKAEDFGDRTIIAGKETKDIYNSAMVDAALDFEKTERQEKEEFYDRTMAAIMRLMDTDAFDIPTAESCGAEGKMLCHGECADVCYGGPAYYGGCRDTTASNYDSYAGYDNGTCEYECTGPFCPDEDE